MAHQSQRSILAAQELVDFGQERLLLSHGDSLGTATAFIATL
jgi:hypothetical protein